jgi:hypothetical protein
MKITFEVEEELERLTLGMDWKGKPARNGKPCAS